MHLGDRAFAVCFAREEKCRFVSRYQMRFCPMGVPQFADWMREHPAERVAAWRGVIDKHDGEEA